MAQASNLAQAFAAVVERWPRRPALSFAPDRHVSYAALDEISNRVARALEDLGVRRGDRVGICADKSLLPYAVMLACIKTGAVYFALDPDNPPARLGKIVSQCEPALLVADAPLELPEYGDRTVVQEACYREVPFADAYPDAPLETPGFDRDDPVYVMFTSGSTGRPKGAVMSVGNLLPFIGWAIDEFGFDETSVHTAVNPLYFDNSVFDFYSSLFSGGSLVPFDAATLRDPAALVERISTMRCDTLFCVPSLLMFLQVMKLATRERLPSLRRIVFGGEGYPKAKLQPLFEQMEAQAELVNVYGPTECTCICSSYRLSAADFDDLSGLPPLGALIPTFNGYILDGEQPIGEGEVGELCLGGPSVGQGYLNRPRQTAAVFVDNPIAGAADARIYRTGDLVRVDPADGKLHFVSRKDLQIKHQGYRIELEEIQQALVTLDDVDEAVALQSLRGGMSSIVAVVASQQGADEAKLRRGLRRLIPRYMVPDKIHVIERMPKNANGKTDRQRLAREYAE